PRARARPLSRSRGLRLRERVPLRPSSRRARPLPSVRHRLDRGPGARRSRDVGRLRADVGARAPERRPRRRPGPRGPVAPPRLRPRASPPLPVAPPLAAQAPPAVAQRPGEYQIQPGREHPAEMVGLPKPEIGGVRISGFFVGSANYNSHIQMVPEFAGNAPVSSEP